MNSRADLVKAIEERLVTIGYRRLPLDKDAAALFFKPVQGVFLTLGIEVSARHRQTFTASFYLSPTFAWAYAPPNGFPLKGFRRIGVCLSPSQRKQIDPTATGQVVDVWWHGFTPENVEQFAHFVLVAEAKFLKDRALQKAVASCPAMRELLQDLAAVQRAHDDKSLAESALVEKVRRVSMVPSRWYHAAAKVAREQAPDYNHKDGVKMLAEESWLLSVEPHRD